MTTWRDESDFDWDHTRDRDPFDPTQDEVQVVPQRAQRSATVGETLQTMRAELLQGSVAIQRCMEGVNGIRDAPNVQTIVESLQGSELAQAVRLASAVGQNALDHFLPVLEQLNALLVRQFHQQQHLEQALYRAQQGALGDAVLCEVVVQK